LKELDYHQDAKTLPKIVAIVASIVCLRRYKSDHGNSPKLKATLSRAESCLQKVVDSIEKLAAQSASFSPIIRLFAIIFGANDVEHALVYNDLQVTEPSALNTSWRVIADEIARVVSKWPVAQQIIGIARRCLLHFASQDFATPSLPMTSSQASMLADLHGFNVVDDALKSGFDLALLDDFYDTPNDNKSRNRHAEQHRCIEILLQALRMDSFATKEASRDVEDILVGHLFDIPAYSVAVHAADVLAVKGIQTEELLLDLLKNLDDLSKQYLRQDDVLFNIFCLRVAERIALGDIWCRHDAVIRPFCDFIARLWARAESGKMSADERALLFEIFLAIVRDDAKRRAFETHMDSIDKKLIATFDASSVRTRMYAALNMHRFAGTFSRIDDAVAIYMDLKRSTDRNDVASRLVRHIALVNIAGKLNVDHLIRQVTSETVLANVCVQAKRELLGWILTRTKWTSLVDLLDEALPSIIHDAFQEPFGNAINKFPFELFGARDFRDFLSIRPLRTKIIFAQAVYSKYYADIQDVATLASVELNVTLKAALPLVFAYLVPLMSGIGTRQEASVRLKWVQRHFGVDAIERLMILHSDAATIEMLFLVNDSTCSLTTLWNGSDVGASASIKDALLQLSQHDIRNNQPLAIPTLPSYPPGAVFSAVKIIAKKQLDVWLKDAFCLQRLIVECQLRWSRCRLSGARRQIVTVCRLVIAAVPECACEPFFVRAIMKLIAVFMEDPLCACDACPLFLKLLEISGRQRPKELVAALTQYLGVMMQNISTWSSQSESCAQFIVSALMGSAKLVKQLCGDDVTKLSWNHLLDASQSPLFGQIAELLVPPITNIRQELGFLARQMCAGEITMAHLNRMRVIMNVDGFAQSLQAADFSTLKRIGSALFDASDRLRKTNGVTLKEVARCVGILASLLPGPMHTERIADVYSKTAVSQVVSADALQLNKKFKLGRTFALYELTNMLWDSNADFVICASNAITAIAQLPSGLDATQKLRDTHISLVSVFRSNTNTNQVLDSVVVDPIELGSPSLWISKEKTLQQFACNLVSAACTHFGVDDVYHYCFEIASQSFDFADKIFPFLMAELLSYGENIKRILSNLINMFFMNVDSQTIDAQLWMIKFIQFLRTQQNPVARTPFDNNFWLDLDYLAISKSALRCGLPMTGNSLLLNHFNRAQR
jgi:hypothetical protein